MKINRINNIKQYILEHNSVSLDKLCEEFKVSKNTIRRDINELEKLGFLKKVYGGVVLNSENNNIKPVIKREISMEKKLISQKAAEMIQDDDIIFIGSGSTTANIIDYIKEKKNITVITNSILVLNKTIPFNNIRLILTGGDLIRNSLALGGIETIEHIKNLNTNKMFISTCGISLTNGLTNSTSIEAEIKRSIMMVSNRKILLADHEKFDTVSLVTICSLDKIDTVITDVNPDEKYIKYFKEHDIDLVTTQ